MGNNKSKIPQKYSGQLLLLTGMPEYDEFYCNLEKNIRKIKAIRLNIDFRLTDFVLDLGAAKLWERKPNFLEILKMLIVVVAVNHKNEVKALNYSKSEPYLVIDTSNCPYKIKSLYDSFKDYIQAVHQGINSLSKMMKNLDQSEIKAILKEHVEEITQKTNEFEYETSEKLKAVENVNKNKIKIKEALRNIDKILELSEEIRKNVKKSIKECKKSPNLEKIIQQCVQARIEKIFSPKDIVRKFWPFPLN